NWIQRGATWLPRPGRVTISSWRGSVGLAEDLRHFLAAPSDAAPSASAGVGSPPVPDQAPATPPATPTAPPSDSKPAPVAPKGLRSFDAHDADFFLDLLPGPRHQRRHEERCQPDQMRETPGEPAYDEEHQPLDHRPYFARPAGIHFGQVGSLRRAWNTQLI